MTRMPLRTLTPLFAVLMLAAVAASALFMVTPARADVDDFTFESMDVEYTLGRADDGTSTLEVVETFVAVFPEFDQNRGMRRSIPDSYLGAPLRPEFVSITDENGSPREAEVDSDDGWYIMTSRAGDYVHGRQTYVFAYRLQNVTRFFSDTGVDEFYWNVNGTDWRQPFGRVTATLRVAPDLAESLTGAMACYRGSTGSTERCEISHEGDAVVATAAELGPFQTMTMAVAFEQGTFTAFDTSFAASPWGWLQSIGILGALGALVSAIVVRVRKLRDAPGRPTIIAEYTPPREIDALESAVLLGRTTKAIPAEVLEQAVAGSIRILEGEKRWWGATKLSAQLIDPSRADADGLMLLRALFPGLVPGDVYEFGRSDTRLSSTAQKILKDANAELTRRGLRRPVNARTRAWPILIAVLSLIVVVLFGVLALAGFVAPAIPIIMIIGTSLTLPVVILLVARKPLTAHGAEVRDHLAGLKEFIEWAEADRIRMLQSPHGAERVPVDTSDPRVMLKLYENLLPYAVVFNQEKEWAERLAVLYGDSNPTWYSGTSGFHAASFSAGISSLSASAASSSSTSGGSGGGGSAGGGGGGGGGGGV